MAKHKLALKVRQQELSAYKFDTSTYIVFGKGVRRDSSTGKLISHSQVSKSGKSKKK